MQKIKTTILLLILFVITTVLGQENKDRNDWENPEVFQINREPARAAFLPYADEVSAINDHYTSCLLYTSPSPRDS